jgi:DNA-binding XRE family transcriptional regulator
MVVFINVNNMVDRIKLIMEYKQLTPAQFAEAIGINRSNLTHLFSGRNLPSLELVRKILTTFPEISTEWLIMNVGNMLTSANQNFDFVDTPNITKITGKPETPKMVVQPDLFQESLSGETNIPTEKENSEATSDSEEVMNDIPVEKEKEVVIESVNKVPDDVPSVTVHLEEKTIDTALPVAPQNKKIEKVIFFYNNKTFDTYYPE